MALVELYPEAFSKFEGKVIRACLPDPNNKDNDLYDIEQGKYSDIKHSYGKIQYDIVCRILSFWLWETTEPPLCH